MSAAANLALYDGRVRMGSVTITAKGFTAVDAAGKKLGRFRNRKLALAAITRRYVANGKNKSASDAVSRWSRSSVSP
jgi:hypothetical protein